MSPRPEYSVPPQTSERTREKLAAEYRAKLDRETRRRRENLVIDVRARRVDVETPSSASRTESLSETRAIEPAARRVSSREETLADVLPTDAPFIYAKSSDEIELRLTPYQRGLFIDLNA
ncbi:hypothetical protein HQ520_05835 [bacterium]|nr:hypothetical protein [bacterium]